MGMNDRYNHLKGKIPYRMEILWILVIIGITIVITAFLLFFKSETQKTEPKSTRKLVRTIIAEKTDERVVITAYGTVQADREVTVRAEVSGRIIHQSQNLTMGSLVKKRETLLNLDPRDYINVVEQEKAAVQKMKFDLEVEKGRQVVASREWDQLKGTLKTAEISEDLALRKPHLLEKKAALDAAESRLKKAQIDLSRTTITSPMDGIVISENTEEGDYVTPQTEIARLVATDKFRVQVSVPVSKLKWITLPGPNGGEGSSVEVLQDNGKAPIIRKGKILRLLGDLDPGGRMARLLVTIEDPLGLKHGNGATFPLLIGSYVPVQIEGPVLKDIVAIPREALHEDNKVWVKNSDNQLEIRQVHIVQRHETAVLVNDGIADGEEIVISSLPLAIPGLELETLTEENTEETTSP